MKQERLVGAQVPMRTLFALALAIWKLSLSLKLVEIATELSGDIRESITGGQALNCKFILRTITGGRL